MNRPLFFFVIFFLIFIIDPPVRVYGQFLSGNNVSYVTMDNGLLHNFIDDIYKDKQGFIWISTTGGGLSRYDGYDFVHYNTNTDPVKLKSNFIRNVCEDDFGRLWIASEGGVDIIDLFTYKPDLPFDPERRLESIMKKPAIKVVKDARGNIWLCSGEILYKVKFEADGSVKELLSLSSVPLNIRGITLKDVDEDGNIWIGLGKRVCKVYEENNTLQALLVAPVLEFEEGIYISAFQSKESEVWIGTHWGLVRYDRNTHSIKRYYFKKNDPRSLSQDYVTDLTLTKGRQLLVSTLRGINIYNPLSDDFEQILQNNVSVNNTINSNFINCMMTDGDIIWVGTETGGVNKITPRRLSVEYYISDKEDLFSLSENLVNAIYEDSNGYLWVGTVEGGLNRKDPESNRFAHYTTDSPSFLSHNSVSVITEDDNNHLWVGTWGNGITLLDINKPDKSAIGYLNTSTHPGFTINFIGSLCYDPVNKGMWIGSNPGIYFYELESGRLINPFPGNIIGNINGSLGAVIDSGNNLWIGSMEGVYIIDLNSRSGDIFDYRYMKYKLDAPDSKIIEKISCFHLSDDGTLWIGSNGYGVYKLAERDHDLTNYTCYTTEDGLINNNIRGILEDNSGRLWISTNNGLSCFDHRKGKFTNYMKEDGLLGNQFYWNAYCRSHTGSLYFGGLNGLMAIDPNRLSTIDMQGNISFTKLWVGNKEVLPGNDHIDSDISTAEVIRLHEGDKSFSLEFSSLNFEPRLSAVYSYYLEGFDEQWIDLPASRRFVNYTNLPSGDYTFYVKYVPEGKNVDECVPASIKISVKPFFYKTTWFISLLLILIILSAIYLYNRRVRFLKKQRRLLNDTVQLRTRELEKQKLVLENQTGELFRQNDMLVQQNEKITRQKQQLVEMSERIQELTIDRLSFFTNITHEFRTPITLITGPVERALKLSNDPKVTEQLNFVERNSKYLLSLVNQLMDFRKVESENFVIVKNNGNIIEFINSLIDPFEAFATERRIKIHRFFRLNAPILPFDANALQKIVANLLSNAIKFTPDGGCVSLYVTFSADEILNEGKLLIWIKDTGTGIREEDISKIFNRFYQSVNSNKFPVYGQSGTGIGLYLAKKIVQSYGGTIQVRNNKRKGATFCISLPAGFPEKINPESSILQTNKPADDSNSIPVHLYEDKLTILIVEDNKDMRNYIKSILIDYYNVIEAENGVGALEMLSLYHIDFIVSDLMMPEMDGIELSRKVKSDFLISHIPFLMLTAKTDTESRLESYRKGVDEYLLKPFNDDLLLTRISNILENRKRYHQRFVLNMDTNDLPVEEESGDKKFINKALEIIKENYKNSYYETSDFIIAMGVSKSLLNKKLQSLTGQSTGQFIRNYRLNRAKELIEKNRITRNMNISEIAYEVGFNDPKYFTRCFTKRFNMTPSSLLEKE